MKIKNPETGEVIVIPQGMEDAVRDAIESGNDPMEAMQMKYGGIHINPANKGKFNATKKATGKTTEELTHSKNPLTRKRAVFAQNASRWKHQDGGQAMQQQQPQGGGQQDQMQQLVQMAEQALAQGTPPEKVAQMLVQQGVPEQVVQQVIQYAIQDLQQQQQAQGQNPQEEAQEQGQQQNLQEEQAEMRYGGMSMYDDGGGINNPGFRALPAYVQQDIINNMRTGGKFLRKAENGIYDDNQPYTPEDEINTNSGMTNYDWKAYDPNKSGYDWNSSPNQFSNPSLIGITGSVNRPIVSNRSQPNLNPNVSSSILPSSGRPFDIGLKDNSFNDRYNSENILSGQSNLLGNQQTTTLSGNTKLSSFDKYNKGLSNITGGNSYFGRGIQHLGQATFDFTKGGIEMAGNNISNRNALQDEANNLRSAMRAGYQKTGKRPTDGNAIISKYGGKMMQDGGATYADKMKVSKNSPEADFIAEKGEYIVNNGIASKLETGGSHASGNDTAISLDKSQSPSYVLSDTPRLKQLQFGGKRVSPSKYAEMATVEVLGKTPDQILKGYTAFTKRANAEGKVFGDKISDATNQLLAQKYQKDLATVKQIADQAYHKQEQLKHAMGMDNDLDHAQQVNGMSMAKFGGMQDGVHMNYFNAPAVQYGGSPQLFSDPSGLGYNTTQMAYGGLHKMQNAGNANPYSDWKGQTFSTPEGYTTPTNVNLNVEPRRNWADYAQYYSSYDPRITTKQTPEAIAALQEVIYDDYLDTPQGQEALNQMWLEYGVTNQLEKDYSDIAEKIKKKENLTESDLKRLRANYIDKLAGKRLPKMLPNAPASETTPKPEAIESKPPVVESQEVDKKPFEYTPAKEKDTYDIPPVNFYIPQPYGRNPIGLQLAQAQTIRPAKLNIQPELNEYTRGMRGALRGTQGNTSVNVAQQMQGLNNLYDAQNKLFGQKYNFDEQSRMGAEQFNAQALMNVDAANLQRIAAEQDAIARREGILDTQRRTDFQAGLENADKQNAYNLSKKYIESTFGPYLNNEGKLNLTYNPLTAEKNTKEKSYTASELNKMTAEQRKALGLKFGGSVKKIKLKLRK